MQTGQIFLLFRHSIYLYENNSVNTFSIFFSFSKIFLVFDNSKNFIASSEYFPRVPFISMYLFNQLIDCLYLLIKKEFLPNKNVISEGTNLEFKIIFFNNESAEL